MLMLAVVLFLFGTSCQILHFARITPDTKTLRERVSNWYYAIDLGDWSTLPLSVLRFCDRFLTHVLGYRLVSLRALSLGSIPSIVSILIGVVGNNVTHEDAGILFPEKHGLSFIVDCIGCACIAGFCDTWLIALSRAIIRKACSGGKRNISFQLLLLYGIVVAPIALLVAVGGIFFAPVRHLPVLWVAFFLFSLVLPILEPLALVFGSMRIKADALGAAALSFTSYLLFLMLLASYAIMFSKKLTRGPLAWFLDRLERNGDMLGLLSTVLLCLSTALALFATFADHAAMQR